MLSLDQPGDLSSLDAVNIVLRARGMFPTSILGPESTEDAKSAELGIGTAMLMLQSGPWNFNRLANYKLSPNTEGHILRPSNILEFRPAGSSSYSSLKWFSGKLWDDDNGTDIFKEDVTISASFTMPFSDMPLPAKLYVTMMASLSFANEETPGDPSLRPTSQQLRDAKVAFEAFDARLVNNSLRDNNAHIYKMRKDR
jgi:hypothetical protein